MTAYDISCRGYCGAHRVAKLFLSRKNQAFRMVDVALGDVPENELGNYFPVENVVYGEASWGRPSFEKAVSSCRLGCNPNEAAIAWKEFIQASAIPEGYKNEGLSYAGYIDGLGWCLPSWIWTNAALVRSGFGDFRMIAGKLLELQQGCGGWIVRNDYGATDVVPVLAPNDSSYIANNAMLTMYRTTKDEKYLNSAIRCAEWIMSVARLDGMVPVGYDMRKGLWQKHNIVDTGFTAALFANLFDITADARYRAFLVRFVDAYVRLFYNPTIGGFATSLDGNDRQLGGQFARGQAWALEGLLPAYKVLKEDRILSVIDQTVNSLLRKQRKDGGWAYNLTRPLMGEDCKGIPVIAKALLDWNAIAPDERLVESARRALTWCDAHTCHSGPARGGIFSFCMEGAVVHHLYTSTAFVYASAYALEVKNALNNV